MEWDGSGLVVYRYGGEDRVQRLMEITAGWWASWKVVRAGRTARQGWDVPVCGVAGR